jgi:serine/threonine-protein kinase
MPQATTADLLADLRSLPLLEAAQREELAQRQDQFDDPVALTRELMDRRWLTPFQANLLLQGRGADLVRGAYVILARVGEGGMGHVFKARHQKLGHIVALKVIRKDRLSNPAAVERFKRELSAAPRVSHPNVVSAFDAGEHQGTLFLAMEFVEGIDLGKLVADSGLLPVGEACEYARQIAEGLAACHACGLVHRDVKPKNLLLTYQGREAAFGSGPEAARRPLIKILDLGLARIDTGQGEQTLPRLTQLGKVVGTIDYMPPEQARDSHHVDARADLYSLGCTLYFLLAGKPPFSGGTKVEKIVSHQLEEAPRLERVRPEVPSELGAVVRKLLAKHPDDRYQTAAEVISALTPFVAGERAAPSAPEPPREKRKSKLIATLPKRVPAPVAVAKSGSAAPEPVIVAVSARPVEPGIRWRTAMVAAAMFGVFAIGLLLVLLLLNQAQPEDTAAQSVTPVATVPTERTAVQPKRGPALIPTSRKPAAPLPELVAVLGDPRRRHWGPVQCVALSPDGNLIASGGHDNSVRIWDAATGQERAAFRVAGNGVAALAFRADGQLIAVGLPANKPPDVRQWDPASGLSQPITLSAAPASAAGFSSDGLTLALFPQTGGGADRKGAVTLWDPSAAKQVGALEESAPVEVFAWSRDGKTLATAAGKTIKTWDVATGGMRNEWTADDAAITCLAVSRDGTQAASASTQWSSAASGDVRLWDTVTGEQTASFRTKEPVSALAFSAQGRIIAVGTGQAEVGRIALYNLAGAKTPIDLEGHGGPVMALAFGSDDKTLLSGSSDHTVRLWEAVSGKEKDPLARQHGPATAIAFAPEGGSLAVLTGPWMPRVRVHDIPSGQERDLPTGHRGGIVGLSFTRDGARVSAWGPWGVTSWDARTGDVAGRMRAPDDMRFWGDLAVDGRTVATAGGKESTIQLWDVLTATNPPTPRASLPGPKGQLTALAIAANLKLLATGGEDQVVNLWDIGHRAEGGSHLRRTLTGHQSAIAALVFTPDGRTLASASRDGTIKLWDVSRGVEQASLANNPSLIASLTFGPNGKMLAVWSVHGLKLWDITAGREVVAGPKLEGILRAVTFAPDGERIAGCDQDGHVIIWRAATGEKLAEWQLGGAVHALAFAPDGRYLATANGNGSAYLIRLGPPPSSIAQAFSR